MRRLAEVLVEALVLHQRLHPRLALQRPLALLLLLLDGHHRLCLPAQVGPCLAEVLRSLQCRQTLCLDWGGIDFERQVCWD